jgi:glutaredoxin 3
MKKLLYTSFVTAIFILLLFACENKQKSIDTSGIKTKAATKSIIFYGSENCDHCMEFRQKADSLKIKYTFKDCEADERNYNELALKIQQANLPGYISFPVVEINGKLYIRPEFDQFLKLIEK